MRLKKFIYATVTITLLFSIAIVRAQTVVYNQAGVTLSYKITKEADFKCKKSKRTLGYFSITVFLENNSGTDVIINWANVYLNGETINAHSTDWDEYECYQELPIDKGSRTVSASTSALTWWPSGSSKTETSIGSWYYNDKKQPYEDGWSIAPVIFRDTTKKKKPKEFYFFLSTNINLADTLYTITSKPFFHRGNFTDSFDREKNEFIRQIKNSSLHKEVYKFLKESENVFPEINIHFSAPWSTDMLNTRNECLKAIDAFIDDIKKAIEGLPGSESKKFLKLN